MTLTEDEAPAGNGTNRSRRESGSDAPGRTPPCNLQAEESLLGAMLLSKGAIAAAVDICTAASFYKPAYGHIFHAVATIAQRGDAADPVTVSDELRRTGLLDAIGGPAVLTDLQGNTPAIGNAAQYARIVEEHALLRRLIGVGAEIAEIGYSVPEDIGAAVVRARDLVARATVESVPENLMFEDVAGVIDGDVDAIQPTMLYRSDGVALVYPGLLHWLMGEPGKGKTFAALYLVAEVLLAGGTVCYLDWEGNRRIVGARLKALGVSADAVRDRFLYLRPKPFTKASALALAAVCEARRVDLVVGDGVAKALARQGLNEDKAPDVLGWLELLVTPLCEAGAAVFLLDHVVKDRESRAQWARGSGAKIGEVSGAAWMLKPGRAFSRVQPGSFSFVQAKDREGFNGADGDTVAVFHVQPHNHGETLTMQVEPPALSTGSDGQFEATIYMERVSRALEGTAAPVASMGAIRSLVNGTNKWKDSALHTLIAQGYVAKERDGYVSVKPYRQPDTSGDPGPAEPPPDDYPEQEELY